MSAMQAYEALSLEKQQTYLKLDGMLHSESFVGSSLDDQSSGSRNSVEVIYLEHSSLLVSNVPTTLQTVSLLFAHGKSWEQDLGI